MNSIVVSQNHVPSQHRLPIGPATDSLRSKESRLLYSSVFRDQHFPQSPSRHADKWVKRSEKCMLQRKDIDLRRKNHRWNQWWEGNVKRVIDLVPKEHRTTLKQQIIRSKEFVDASVSLPRGIIHGDLFCDNALFYEGQLAGIIDFYNACDGCLLFDLAITINDWCSTPKGVSMQTKPQHSSADIMRYVHSRLRTHWPRATETAALRFWMLRLVALARKREGGPKAPPHVKDPNDFLVILVARHTDPQCDLISA